MNNKEIPTDKQEELTLRAEPFLSGEKTPTANADEFYTLLRDFEGFFNDLEISDELRPLEKIWNQLRLLDEIYASISLYTDIDETDIDIEFGAQNNHAEHIEPKELQIRDILNMSEYEKFKLRAAPFLLGRKSPIENEDEYIAVHDDLVEFMPNPNFRKDASLPEIYSKWHPLQKILDSFHLLDGIYRSMSQLNIDETEITIRFKNLNNDTEYIWSDDFQMRIDYVFHFAEDNPAPKVERSILGRTKLVYDNSAPIHKEFTVVVGKIESGMLSAKDTVLINGRAYDISHIIHTGYNPQDMKYYAEPGMNIALVLESERPCYIIPGSLVTKKEESK